MRRSKAKIQAVATDMASGYIAAVLEYLPKADLVLDHFHLVKWFNEKLSLLRRQLYHQATQMQKAVLKGSRWLLLKSPENLNPTTPLRVQKCNNVWPIDQYPCYATASAFSSYGSDENGLCGVVSLQ